MVSKALSCMAKQADSIKDTYAISLVTYAFVLAKHDKATDMIRLLRSKATDQGNLMIKYR